MKKNLSITLATLIATVILFSCKKNNDPTPKDYVASIKDKTWSGQLTYTGKTKEYYSIHFNADNSLLWSQFSGDYTGNWVIKNKTLTMTFDASSAQIKADITDNNKLINITDNTGSYEINSGELIENPNISLDNTVWLGSKITGAGTSLTYKLSFMPGLKVETQTGNNKDGPFTYTRSSAGAVIRAYQGGTNYLFGVVVSGNAMKGTDIDPQYVWQTIKQ